MYFPYNEIAEVVAGFTTVTSTDPVPAGATAVIWLALSTLKLVAFVAPNLTAVAPVKLVPAITTEVAPLAGPEVGVMLVIVGAP